MPLPCIRRKEAEKLRAFPIVGSHESIPLQEVELPCLYKNCHGDQGRMFNKLLLNNFFLLDFLLFVVSSALSLWATMKGLDSHRGHNFFFSFEVMGVWEALFKNRFIEIQLAYGKIYIFKVQSDKFDISIHP